MNHNSLMKSLIITYIAAVRGYEIDKPFMPKKARAMQRSATVIVRLSKIYVLFYQIYQRVNLTKLCCDMNKSMPFSLAYHMQIRTILL